MKWVDDLLGLTTSRDAGDVDVNWCSTMQGEPAAPQVLATPEPAPPIHPPEPPTPVWDWKEHVATLAKSEKRQLLTRATKIMAELEAEHERDTSAYRFECKRWGDFLSIFVDRMNGDQLVRVTQSINIGQSRSIIFEPGRAPDKGAIAVVMVSQLVPLGPQPRHDNDRQAHWEWQHAMERADNIGGVLHASISAKSKLWGAKTNVYRAWSRGEVPVSREHQAIHLEVPRPTPTPTAPQNRREGDGAAIILEKMPRGGFDDRIYFEGPGITLFIPAGLGRKVHDQIMREIAGETDIVDDNAEHGTLIRQGDRTVLLVRCPSTNKPTLLVVPPAMRTAAEARAWTFGLTAKQFATDVET